MHGRGNTVKTRTDKEMTLERAMVTRHYKMRWKLEYCVGCQIGPSICPFEALTHVDAVLEDGRMVGVVDEKGFGEQGPRKDAQAKGKDGAEPPSFRKFSPFLHKRLKLSPS